jgi:hypothetical protein
MSFKMPRGALPTPRNELAASERYSLGADSEVFVPSGEFPSPNNEIVAATPYRAGTAPESFLSWPIEISFWGTGGVTNSLWIEEAFAKACAEPGVFIPTEVVIATARECGSANFAKFMQMHGFQMSGDAYLDGPFKSVDWTNTAALNSAIANVGPVKIGVAAANLASVAQGRVIAGTSGWAIYGLPTGQPGNHCASLCGYGPLPALADLFERRGINVNLPSGMPAGLCYAMFTWDSIGIVDRTSLMNITGEAWIRTPTTIVKNLSG